MKILSIIIPIYNVEPYLEKCLRSIENQDISHEDYEIICINDGSPDKSRDVVLSLQSEFNNILLIDQKNKGVSIARNNGIIKSNGKYLLFIDPDDYIEENSLGSILKETVSNHAQLVLSGYTFIDLDNNLLGKTNFDSYVDNILPGIEGYYISHTVGQMGADLAVGIIFEADYLKNNNLYYLPDVPFLEDGEFLARAHCLADRCILRKRLLYTHIVVRQGSATNSDMFNSERARKGFILSANHLKNFQHTLPLDVKQKLFLNGSIVQFVLLVVYSALRTRSIKTLINSINNLRDNGLDNLKLDGCRGWYLICGKPYNLSPYLGALVLLVYFKLDNLYSVFLKNRLAKK